MKIKPNVLYISLVIVIVLGLILIILKLNMNKESGILTDTDAIKLGKELYDKSMDYYWCDFIYAEDGSIENYEEIQNHFTSNGNLNFEKYLSVSIRNNKAYEKESMCARDANLTYSSTELYIEKLEKELIEYKASSIYCLDLETDECIETKEETESFIIKKINDIWKVDEFFLPN